MIDFSKRMFLKIFTIIAAFSIFITTAQATDVKKANLSVNYDNNAYILCVEGNTLKAREPVTVRICKYNALDVYTDEPDANKNQEPDVGEPVLFRTVLSGKDASVSLKINFDLSEGILQGRYKCDVGYGNEWILSKMIMLIDSGKISTETITAMNGKKEDIEEIISENGEIYKIMDNGKDKEYSLMAQMIKNMKPADGYNFNKFLDVYLIAEELCLYYSGEIEFADFINSYSEVIGSGNIGIYNELPDKVKDYVKNLFKENVVKKPLDKEFSDNIFAARYYNENDIKQFKKLVIEYVNASDEELKKDFNSLDTLSHDSVVTALYNKKNSLIPAEDILDKIKTEINKAIEVRKNTESDSSAHGSGGGGKGTATVSGKVASASPKPVLEDKKAEFNDIDTHWAKNTIENMTGLNYLNGFEDGSFRPDDDIKRAEFTAIICRMLKLEEAEGHTFKDVGATDWFAGYVETAYQNGLIKGFDGVFLPDEHITREDAAVIIDRILNTMDVAVDSTDVNYSDSEQISDYARVPIFVLHNANLLIGFNGCINPKNNLTRAEAATLLERVISLNK